MKLRIIISSLLAAVYCASGETTDEAVQMAHGELWRRFIDPTWHTFYDHAGLDGKVVLPTAEECRAGKPNAMSWDISITDGAMFGGFYMDAAIHRWKITNQAEDLQKVRRIASGLMKLASVGQTKGFIARGLTADGSAHYALSSEDQTLPWLYGMWRYVRSDIPGEKERQQIIAKIVEIAEALRSHGWKIPCDRPPFDFRGSFAGVSWWGAPRLLFLLKMTADVSGDKRWEEFYRQALTEKAPSGKVTRLEICAQGMVSARQTYHTWTACPGVIGLRGLWELETDPALKAAYEQGLKRSATVAAESLPLALQFDNNDQQKFLLDWRELNTLWHQQNSVSEASKLAHEQLRLLDSRSPRRDYEARLVREPMFAAWVVSLCPDLAVLQQHAPAIFQAIRHYRYERLYISQFFPGEAAYYRLKLSGIAMENAGLLPKKMLPLGIPKDVVIRTAFRLTTAYLEQFQHPRLNILYGTRMVNLQKKLPSPDDVKHDKPHPKGYGTPLADIPMQSGHVLGALLAAHAARPDRFLEDCAKKVFAGMKIVGSATREKGVIPRGPHPDDMTAYYDNSTWDQYSSYMISMAYYAKSSIASEADKTWLRANFEAIGKRLEQHGWSPLRERRGPNNVEWGGKMLTTHTTRSTGILLPTVYSVYLCTGNTHWLEFYEKLCAEGNGLRWEKLAPGPHNLEGKEFGLYTSHHSFVLKLLYDFDTKPERRKTLQKLLAFRARYQMETEQWPDRRNTNDVWKEVSATCAWGSERLTGYYPLCAKFKPSFLDIQSGSVRYYAQYAHLRGGLDACCSVLLSCDRALLDKYLPVTWSMLTQLSDSGLAKIDSGESFHMIPVVALYMYANYFDVAMADGAKKAAR